MVDALQVERLDAVVSGCDERLAARQLVVVQVLDVIHRPQQHQLQTK